MNPTTLQQLNTVLDRYVTESELHALLKGCIDQKVKENSIWGELTKTVHEMFGGRLANIADVAAVSEMILLALDIVDDLQDQDNPEMPWMKSGLPYALNAILSLVFASMGELARFSNTVHASGNENSIDLHVVSSILAYSINGQQRDIRNDIETEQDYITMIQVKSGSLLKLACYLGYSTAGMNKPEVIEQMDELAVIIGIVSQIRNDVRDLTRWDLKNDLLQKKRTLPVLFLLADEEGYQPFRDYYNGNISQAEFLLHKQACLSYIQQSGCIEYCSVIQTLFLNRAEQLLEALDIPLEAKDRFRKLTLGSPKADPSAAMAEVQISS